MEAEEGFCCVYRFDRELIGGVELLGEIEEFGGGFGIAAVFDGIKTRDSLAFGTFWADAKLFR